MASQLSLPDPEEVLEGVIVEHNGRPYQDPHARVRHFWGVDPTHNPTSAHFVLHEDGTIQQVSYPQEWK